MFQLFVETMDECFNFFYSLSLSRSVWNITLIHAKTQYHSLESWCIQMSMTRKLTAVSKYQLLSVKSYRYTCTHIHSECQTQNLVIWIFTLFCFGNITNMLLEIASGSDIFIECSQQIPIEQLRMLELYQLIRDQIRYT